MHELEHVARSPGDRRPATEQQLLVDVAVGVVSTSVGAGLTLARGTSRVVAPVARLAWRPALLPARLQPATLVAGIARIGEAERRMAVRRLGELLDTWVPVLVEELVRRLDLTAVVKERVRLDEVVEAVDLDAAVARVSIDAIVDRLDLNAVATRLDLDAIVARVDLDAIVARVDLDAIVARVDVDPVVARVDIDAIIDRIDLVALVQEVMDEIDLPAIIRESTGSMASETVRGVRMSGISADDAVSRVVDRALFRRRRPDKPAVGPG